MSRYRFKTKEEFIRDGLWDEENNCPDNWNFRGGMNMYLGTNVPEEFNMDCVKNRGFDYNDWIFSKNDYVLKEQQKYFPDLSQHIGRYIKALVDNPHSGMSVKKGDIGKIIDYDKVDFPNNKDYYCNNALSEKHLGISYELLPEGYSPEQEDVPERISFYVKYTKEFTEDLYNSLWEWSKKNSEFPSRDFADSYEGLKKYKFYVFDNWTLNCNGIYGNDSIHKYSYGVDNNKQSCEKEYTIEQVKKLIGYKEPNVEFIPGKWYNFTTTKGKYNLYVKVDFFTDRNLFFMNRESISDGYLGKADCIDIKFIENPRLVEDLSEIQDFLPDGHPDKITSNEFKKGEYIVITDKFDSWSKDFISNHIYKQRKDSTYLQPEYDSSDSITNGWVKYKPEYPNWRYATQEEIDEYEKRGKPYDVTELHKKQLSIKEIQEECKRRFPIGCTYLTPSESTYVLKDDAYTYCIFGQTILAHSGGGLLYEDGNYATLVSLPKQNDLKEEAIKYSEETNTTILLASDIKSKELCSTYGNTSLSVKLLSSKTTSLINNVKVVSSVNLKIK